MLFERSVITHHHQLEEAITHKSAKTHVVFVLCDLKLLTSKINQFQGHKVERFLSSLVILVASAFDIIMRKNTDRQTYRQTRVKTLPSQLPSAWVVRCIDAFKDIYIPIFIFPYFLILQEMHSTAGKF